MSPESEDLPSAPPAWPPFAALAAVVFLAVALVAVDLIVERNGAQTTTDLVEDSLHSVAIAADLRAQVHRLVDARRQPQDLVEIAGQIAHDIDELDPIARSPAERGEWMRLQLLLSRLQRNEGERAADARELEASIDRLIRINEREASANVASIHALHRSGIEITAGAGVITFALAVAIGLALLRSLRQQRSLIEARVAVARERRRDLEAFAGRVAHDLRGPLTPMRGYADLLASASPGDARKLAQRLTRSIDRMSSIIDDLLTLSTSGQLAGGEAPVATIVREVVEDLHDSLDDANVKLELAECKARCTPSVLGQIVGNLVTNAVKYKSPQRPLALSISAAPRDKDVEIVVADNGIGMDEHTRAHVFEPFYRARDTAHVPGHGLGLAIVKRTVEALHGSCELASERDKGTAVTIRLPSISSTGRDGRRSEMLPS